MNQPKICVYAICKNEKDFIDQWLDSMSEADYIVVLDTGSTDGTFRYLQRDRRVKKVRKKIINPWRFDVARNESMKLAPDDTDIFVCTDIDESFEPGWADAIRETWDPEKHKRGVYKYVWSHSESNEPGLIYLYNKIHAKGAKWIHAVHELLADDSDNEPESVCYFDDRVMLHHYPDDDKVRNYFDLIKLRAEEEPEDHLSQYYLAREYALSGDLSTSLNEFMKVLSMKDIDNTPQVKMSSLIHVADIYNASNLKDDAVMWYHRAMNFDRTYFDPYLGIAEILITNQFPEAGLGMIQQGIKNSIRHYDWVEKPNTWNERQYDLLGTAYAQMGMLPEAESYILTALSFNPSNEALQNNLKIVRDGLKTIAT